MEPLLSNSLVDILSAYSTSQIWSRRNVLLHMLVIVQNYDILGTKLEANDGPVLVSPFTEPAALD